MEVFLLRWLENLTLVDAWKLLRFYLLFWKLPGLVLLSTRCNVDQEKP